MATMLTGQGILNSVASMLTDTSAGTRTKMIIWLNMIVEKLAADRIDWDWVRKTSLNLTITANQITLPADFQRVIYIKSGSNFYLEQEDELTDEAVYRLQAVTVAGTIPIGYQDDVVAGKITLYPGASGVCDLRYLAEHPAITDSATAILFPKAFEPVLVRGCLDFFYEYDMDLRAASSYQLDAILLGALYESELARRPLPQANSHGYMRERQ
jgi:hypothetical protein